jgi:hypothetical protein
VLDCWGHVIEIGIPPDSGRLDALASSATPLIETPRGISKIAELPIGGSAIAFRPAGWLTHTSQGGVYGNADQTL